MSSCSCPVEVELDNGQVIDLPRDFVQCRASRAALRRWLDAADARPCFYGVDAFFSSDPADYNWSIVQGNGSSRVVVFQCLLPCGVIRMNYYFTTGAVQLIHDNRYFRGVGGPSDPRRVQETYKDLTEQDFADLLRNPAWFFREGWTEPPRNSYHNARDHSAQYYNNQYDSDSSGSDY